MKKIVVLFAVFALAAPIYAADDVIIDCTQVKEGTGYRIYVNYDASGTSSRVRGFSFHVKCDSNAVIQDIADYKTNVFSTSSDKGYGVYLSQIYFGSDPNTIDDEGSPDAKGHIGALGGVGTNEMTVDLASLWDPGDTGNAPDDTGGLFSFKVDKLCVITFEEETAHRGGTILEDGSKANFIAPPHVVAWEVPGQCSGDADFNGVINTDDFLLFGYAFGFNYTHYDDTGATVPPAKGYHLQVDFDHNGYINTDDFLIFATNFGKPLTPVVTSYTWPPF